MIAPERTAGKGFLRSQNRAAVIGGGRKNRGVRQF
jgi:hypothetical protein